MKSNELKHEIGKRYRIKSSVTGESVIGEVVEVEKHYLMNFGDFFGNPATGWFNEKHLSPVTIFDLGVTVGNIVAKNLDDSFKNKLREEKLLEPEAGVFSAEMRQAIREEIAAFHGLDKFLSANHA